MDFVFDRVAGGRAIKNRAVIDDATHEAVAVVAEGITGHHQGTTPGRACSPNWSYLVIGLFNA